MHASQRYARSVFTLMQRLPYEEAAAIDVAERLAERSIDPPIGQSANGPGGDAANAHHLHRFERRVKKS